MKATARLDLERFRKLFEEQIATISNKRVVMHADAEMRLDEIIDEVDRSGVEWDQAMDIRMRYRETLYLKKLVDALDRIHKGTFGTCMECEEPIGLRRLEARPTSELCLDCKEAQENTETHYIDGHQHKSVGQLIRFA